MKAENTEKSQTITTSYINDVCSLQSIAKIPVLAIQTSLQTSSIPNEFSPPLCFPFNKHFSPLQDIFPSPTRQVKNKKSRQTIKKKKIKKRKAKEMSVSSPSVFHALHFRVDTSDYTLSCII